MTEKELSQYNKKALKKRNSKVNFEQKLTLFPYFGFVKIQLEGINDFLMFSNNDDIVAKTFFFNNQKAFEPLSLLIWTELAKSSEYVFDVGAFSGIYSLSAAIANKNAKVWGFEPSGKTYNRFVTNILTNQLYNRICPLNIALGDVETKTTLKHPAQLYSMASGESIEEKDGIKYYSEETIAVYPGDAIPELFESKRSEFPIEYSLKGLDLVKIDVEGFEENVIKGLTKMIEAYSPTMIIECLDETSFEKVNSILRKFDYKYFFINETKMKLENDRQIIDDARNVLFYKRDNIEQNFLKFK